MNAQIFAGLKVARDQFAGEFEPGNTLSAESLQQEAISAENARAQRLLKTHANLNLRGRAEEAVAMDHVFVSGRDFDGNDVPGEFGRYRGYRQRRRNIRS